MYFSGQNKFNKSINLKSGQRNILNINKTQKKEKRSILRKKEGNKNRVIQSSRKNSSRVKINLFDKKNTKLTKDTDTISESSYKSISITKVKDIKNSNNYKIAKKGFLSPLKSTSYKQQVNREIKPGKETKKIENKSSCKDVKVLNMEEELLDYDIMYFLRGKRPLFDSLINDNSPSAQKKNIDSFVKT